MLTQDQKNAIMAAAVICLKSLSLQIARIEQVGDSCVELTNQAFNMVGFIEAINLDPGCLVEAEIYYLYDSLKKLTLK